MTNTTTDKSKSDRRKKRRGANWFYSFGIHVLVLVILGYTGLLDVNLILNREDQKDKAKEIKAREKKRAQAERKRQHRKKLSKEHAKRARKEAQRRRKRELAKRVQQMLKTRKQMLQVKAQKLDQIKNRSSEEYRQKLADQIKQDANFLEKATEDRMRAPDRRGEEHQTAHKSAEEVLEKSDQIQETPEDYEYAKKLSETAEQTQKDVETALLKEKKGDPRAKEKSANHPMTKAAERIKNRSDELSKKQDMNQINDTSSARKPEEDSDLEKQAQNTASMSPEELYKLAKKLEDSTEAHYKDVRAAELAQKQNTSFQEAQKKLAQNKNNNDKNLSKDLSKDLKTVGDLANYRKALNEAIRQTRGREMRTRNMLDQAMGRAGRSSGGGGYRGPIAMGLGTGPSSQGGGGGFGGTHSDSVQQTGGAFMENLDKFRRLGVNSKVVEAQSLPGRKFTKNSLRKGWLYVDTWYIIGPWDNGGRIDYDNVHPPEYEIDFDAVYGDGKKGKSYTSKKGWTELDGTLSWRFTQSDTVRVLPFTQTSDATHYAYTELYFEEDTEMLVAIASDDATRVWINGKVVWEELGLSSWALGERFERAVFREGTNTVLIRLENGPGETLFSFLICPPDALNKK